jgi:hypothetical protein
MFFLKYLLVLLRVVFIETNAEIMSVKYDKTKRWQQQTAVF